MQMEDPNADDGEIDCTHAWTRKIEHVRQNLVREIDTKIDRHIQEKSKVFESIKSSGVLVTTQMVNEQMEKI